MAAGGRRDFGAGPQGQPCQAWRVHKSPRGELFDQFHGHFLHKVSWDSPENALWTLAMVGPDSQLQGEGEVLHWLVANIPGNKVEDGQTLAPYLQPHPAFGTGYHRYELLCSCPGSFWLTPDVSRKASQKMHPFLFPLRISWRKHRC